MVICPIALAVHCSSCPIVKFCPAKTILGDYKEESDKSAGKAGGPDSEQLDSTEKKSDSEEGWK